jgi:hypothetical protein
LIAAAAVLLAIAALTKTAMALEEPAYTVIAEFEDWELRLYEPYLVAETRVDGDLRGSGNQAFRILAGYIFGDNQPGTKMAMTAPVLSERTREDGYVYQFVMESAYDLDTLPVPNDARVELREIPRRLVAALRFSGTWNEQRMDDLTTGFLEAVDRAGYTPVSDPMLARYNPPLTPWFMRRNELLVEVTQPR